VEGRVEAAIGCIVILQLDLVWEGGFFFGRLKSSKCLQNWCPSWDCVSDGDDSEVR
jgi:hypothetical protein